MVNTTGNSGKHTYLSRLLGEVGLNMSDNILNDSSMGDEGLQPRTLESLLNSSAGSQSPSPQRKLDDTGPTAVDENLSPNSTGFNITESSHPHAGYGFLSATARSLAEQDQMHMDTMRLTIQLEEITQQRDVLHRSNMKLVAENTTLHERETQLQTELAKLQRTNAAAQGTLRSSKTTTHSMEQKLGELRRAYNKKEAELEQCVSLLSEMRSRESKLRLAAGNKRKEALGMQELANQTGKENDKLTERNTKLREQYDKLHARYEEAQAHLSRAMKSLTEMQDRLIAAEQSLDTKAKLEDDIFRHRRENEELVDHIRTLESRIESLRNKLEEKVRDREIMTVKALESDELVKEKERTIALLQETSDSQQETIEELRDMVQFQANEIKAMQEANDKYVGEIRTKLQLFMRAETSGHGWADTDVQTTMASLYGGGGRFNQSQSTNHSAPEPAAVPRPASPPKALPIHHQTASASVLNTSLPPGVLRSPSRGGALSPDMNNTAPSTFRSALSRSPSPSGHRVSFGNEAPSTQQISRGHAMLLASGLLHNSSWKDEPADELAAMFKTNSVTEVVQGHSSYYHLHEHNGNTTDGAVQGVIGGDELHEEY
eukprot:Clim_evm16s165 gene=Clim_evmTU16s165